MEFVVNNDHIYQKLFDYDIMKERKYFAIKEVLIGWLISSFMMKLWRFFDAH
jgi:hypothetical protein